MRAGACVRVCLMERKRARQKERESKSEAERQSKRDGERARQNGGEREMERAGQNERGSDRQKMIKGGRKIERRDRDCGPKYNCSNFKAKVRRKTPSP